MVFPHSHANKKYLQSPGKYEMEANEADRTVCQERRPAQFSGWLQEQFLLPWVPTSRPNSSTPVCCLHEAVTLALFLSKYDLMLTRPLPSYLQVYFRSCELANHGPQALKKTSNWLATFKNQEILHKNPDFQLHFKNLKIWHHWVHDLP